MKYEYIGPERREGGKGPIMAYGYDFGNGAVEVKEERAINKLDANPEFTKKKTRKAK